MICELTEKGKGPRKRRDRVEGEEGGHRVKAEHRVGVEGEEGGVEAEPWVEGEEGGHHVEDQHRVSVKGKESGVEGGDGVGIGVDAGKQWCCPCRGWD
jgi:hypothetical protein